MSTCSSIAPSLAVFLAKGKRMLAQLMLGETIIIYANQVCAWSRPAPSTGYVRTKHYSISNMEEREKQIRVKAEDIVNSTLFFPKRIILNWVLFHARRGVRHRENTRFSRTKLFGLFRTLFRSIGKNLTALGLLKDQQVDQTLLTTLETFL